MMHAAVEARYTPYEIGALAGNPCVEALGPILSREDWISQLKWLPPFDPEQRAASVEIRKDHVVGLREVFVPLPPHLELAERIAQALRMGYAQRSPITNETAALQRKAYERLHEKGKGRASLCASTPITTVSLIGHSGMGKTTTIERILSTYPNVIHHPDHGFYQLVWIKVDCPRNGSVKGLAKAIVWEIDKAMNTDYHRTFSTRTVEDDIIYLLQRLILANHIGMLVVDEIQNLAAVKSGGSEAMVNFFQELCNTLKIPVVLAGTNQAFEVLGGRFRTARRAGTLGTSTWNPLANDRMWRALVANLLRYQWVRDPVECSDELVAYLHDRTQGIPAVLSQLLIHAQQTAIHSGEETLTCEIFDDVLAHDLPLIQDMLAALRSNDPRRYAEYDDVRPTYTSPVLDDRPARSEGAPPPPARGAKGNKHPADAAVANLVSMGYEWEAASAAVNQLWSENVRRQRTLTERALKALSGVEKR